MSVLAARARALSLPRPLSFILARPRLAAALAFWATWLEVRVQVAVSGSPHRPVTGNHVHHLVDGLVILLVAGSFDLLGRGRLWRPVLFGVGAALLLDEFGLVWYLRDVYWAPQGSLSLVVAAVFGFGLTVAAAHEFRRRR